VQLFARNQHADRPQIGRTVVSLEVSVALCVGQAVDHAGREERHAAELNRDQDDAGHTE
jgi:hypothetical protein